MSKDTYALPETRTWREIPQQVRPRAMSMEGRRRMAMGVMRAVIGTAVIVGVSWGAWEVAAVLRDKTDAMPDAAKSDRVRSLVLATDGVLDRNWLAKTLSIAPDATLMGLDLNQLRAKVLADEQVSTASIVRNFPDTLTVRISERSPVARMMAQAPGGAPKMLLVARDGIAFAGVGFDPAMVETLPWLDGITLSRTPRGLEPIEGMRLVSDLLASAKLEAENLYRNWQVISLAHLATDGEIEVHTRDGMKIIFGTKEDYLRQIARLDLLVDESNDPTRPLREVNLALGAQVPVAYGTAAPTLNASPAAGVLDAHSAAPQIAFPSISTPHIDVHREL
ncbi:MAG: FtsQ-type POTRA domain-containing protein [Opitutaceae bacterium]|jgi:cell division protein FtsQ